MSYSFYDDVYSITGMFMSDTFVFQQRFQKDINALDALKRMIELYDKKDWYTLESYSYTRNSYDKVAGFELSRFKHDSLEGKMYITNWTEGIPSTTSIKIVLGIYELQFKSFLQEIYSKIKACLHVDNTGDLNRIKLAI